MLNKKIPMMLQEIQANAEFLKYNSDVLNIYQGDLLRYIQAAMKSSLSENYYNKIKERLIPVNILQKLIDKLAKVYTHDPVRKIEGGNKNDEELLEYYEQEASINDVLLCCDEYSQMHKGYAFEPYIKNRNEKLGGNYIAMRAIPFDRFLVIAKPGTDDEVEIFIKFMGSETFRFEDRRFKGNERVEIRDIYYAYTDDEFLAFDSSGDIRHEKMAEVLQDEVTGTFINPYGVIPFYYGQRSKTNIIPTPNMDILALSKTLPIILSDLSGAIMFQCFTIIWGLDVDLENASMNPNAFWELKSSVEAGKEAKPQIGTIKPEVDVEKVLDFVMNVFAFWLDTKGIKIGSIGKMKGDNMANGISKILDEMDTSEAILKSQKAFKRDEKAIWPLIKVMHNFWVDSKDIEQPKFSEGSKIDTKFEKPLPLVDRKNVVETIKLEVDEGFKNPEAAIRELYPNDTEKQIREKILWYNEKFGQEDEEPEKETEKDDEVADGLDEGKNKDSKGI